MPSWTQILWPTRASGRTHRPRLVVECLEDRSLMAVVVLGPFTLNGAQEVPPVATAATGTATVTVDTTALVFSVDATVSGIALANVIGFHLHRGAPGVDGPIVVDLLASGTFMNDGLNIRYATANIPLPAAELPFLLAGKEYLNVHTPAFTGGEIRGQVPAPPAGTPGALANVTSQVTVTLGKAKFNPATKRSRVKVTIHNHGAALEGPLTLVLRNLNRKLKLRKASGSTASLLPAGSPFRIIQPPGGVFASGGSVTVLLEFNNPMQKKVRFSGQLFVGPGAA